MTSKKTNKKTDDASAEKPVDVAPYLSAKKETPETSEDSGLFTPFILTLALAAAIFVIFYGGEYRNLMAGLGFDIEEPAVSKTVTATKPADSMMTSVSAQVKNDVVPPVNILLDNTANNTKQAEGLHIAPAAAAPGKTEKASSSIAPTPAASAPASVQPYNADAYTYAPVPPYAYNYPPAYRYYPPQPDYYDYDRSYDHAQSGTNQSYEDTLKQQEAMLKQMEIEYAETRKAYEERVRELKQERQQARLAYKETLKKRRQERDQARDQARKAYEESLKNRPETTSPY